MGGEQVDDGAATAAPPRVGAAVQEETRLAKESARPFPPTLIRARSRDRSPNLADVCPNASSSFEKVARGRQARWGPRPRNKNETLKTRDARPAWVQSREAARSTYPPLPCRRGTCDVALELCTLKAAFQRQRSFSSIIPHFPCSIRMTVGLLEGAVGH